MVSAELVVANTTAGLEAASLLASESLGAQMRAAMLAHSMLAEFSILQKPEVSIAPVDRLACLEGLGGRGGATLRERGADEEEDKVDGELCLPVNPDMDIVVQGLLWALRCPALAALRPRLLLALRHVTLGSRDRSQLQGAGEGDGQRGGGAVELGQKGGAAVSWARMGRLGAAERMRGFVAAGGLRLLLSCWEEAAAAGDAAGAGSEEDGVVEEEVCALLSALLASGVVAPSEVLSLSLSLSLSLYPSLPLSLSLSPLPLPLPLPLFLSDSTSHLSGPCNRGGRG